MVAARFIMIILHVDRASYGVGGVTPPGSACGRIVTFCLKKASPGLINLNDTPRNQPLSVRLGRLLSTLALIGAHRVPVQWVTDLSNSSSIPA